MKKEIYHNITITFSCLMFWKTLLSPFLESFWHKHKTNRKNKNKTWKRNRKECTYATTLMVNYQFFRAAPIVAFKFTFVLPRFIIRVLSVQPWRRENAWLTNKETQHIISWTTCKSSLKALIPSKILCFSNWAWTAVKIMCNLQNMRYQLKRPYKSQHWNKCTRY